jgi:hypothetical protein
MLCRPFTLNFVSEDELGNERKSKARLAALQHKEQPGSLTTLIEIQAASGEIRTRGSPRYWVVETDTGTTSIKRFVGFISEDFVANLEYTKIGDKAVIAVPDR